MTYHVSSGRKDSVQNEESDTVKSDDMSDDKLSESENKEEMNQSVEPIGEERKVSLFIPDWDFILGLEDLSGELMRHSIKCVSSGRIEETFKACDFIRNLYTSLLTLTQVHNREFFKKLNVMLQSLLKVENACHMIKLRGSEVSQDLLVHMIGTFNTNEDEECSYD
ncbi:hypothetical protein LSTR_LSTR016091 [Laodelphax striatellus]|uniref:Uncharacterized protein n=1 Tax=Laodelphax striatellus TaxID=195883 RepID=A0A482WNN0_LAOST|nr:hypothetical protein LSTR_LSTR016091 [Laodelphax striatellus]